MSSPPSESKKRAAQIDHARNTRPARRPAPPDPPPALAALLETDPAVLTYIQSLQANVNADVQVYKDRSHDRKRELHTWAARIQRVVRAYQSRPDVRLRRLLLADDRHRRLSTLPLTMTTPTKKTPTVLTQEQEGDISVVASAVASILCDDSEPEEDLLHIISTWKTPVDGESRSKSGSRDIVLTEGEQMAARIESRLRSVIEQAEQKTEVVPQKKKTKVVRKKKKTKVLQKKIGDDDNVSPQDSSSEDFDFDVDIMGTAFQSTEW